MAGIAVLDELAEAERRIRALEEQVGELTRAGQEIATEYETLEQQFAERLAAAAARLESLADTLYAAAPLPQS